MIAIFIYSLMAALDFLLAYTAIVEGNDLAARGWIAAGFLAGVLALKHAGVI